VTAGTDVTNVLLGIAVLVGVGVVSFPLTVRPGSSSRSTSSSTAV